MGLDINDFDFKTPVEGLGINNLIPNYLLKKEKIKCCKNGKKYYKCKVVKHLLKYDFAIISAFASEQFELNKKFEIMFPDIGYGGRLFKRGIIDGKLIVSVLSGVGMSNASMTTQMLISYFDPANLIFSGIAGSMAENNRIGDVVISARCAQIHHQKYARDHEPSGGFFDRFDFETDFPNKYFRVQDNKVISLTTTNCEGCPNDSANNIIDNNNDPPLVTKQLAIPMAIDTFTDPLDAYKQIIPQQFFFDVDENLLDVANKVHNWI